VFFLLYSSFLSWEILGVDAHLVEMLKRYMIRKRLETSDIGYCSGRCDHINETPSVTCVTAPSRLTVNELLVKIE